MNIFKSFWMGGFECSDQINSSGKRVNLLEETGHLVHLTTDYKLLLDMNISTVREGVQWSVAEVSPYQYNFDTVKLMMEEGQRLGMQQVWDLCHFGFPSDLTPLHPEFVKRFVSFCTAFGSFFVENFGGTDLIVTPINEVSFLSWLGGDAKGTVPFCENEGWNVKYKLMAAYIEGVKALKSISSQFKILSTEPLVNMVPRLDANEEDIIKAKTAHENQFQVLDILTGRTSLELGGSPECLDVIGLNFYYNNQWVHNSIEGYFLPWANEDADPRWRPLSSLIEEVYRRYNYPIILAETSHSDEDRGKWINQISGECMKLLSKNIPFYGICMYPIIARPDWDDLSTWYNSGIWDCDLENSKARIPDQNYVNTLLHCQEKLAKMELYDITEGTLNSKNS